MSSEADVGGGTVPSTADGHSEGSGNDILSRYESNKWGSVNDLVENSTIISVDDLECQKFVEKVLRFEDSERVQEVPVTQAGRMDIDAQYAEEPAELRDRFVPADFEEGHVDFARPDTERVNTCSSCGGNGRSRCQNCSGSGHNSCRRCNGSGRNNDSVCNKCGGSGTRVCGDCDGTGSIACDTCEQKGETWKLDFVRREYTPEETVTANVSEVPESFVTDAEGEFVRTEEHELADNEIRHEVDVFNVAVTKVDYSYDGTDYELYEIDGEDLKSENYPKNQARKLLPYVGGGLVLVVIGIVALMQMGVL